MDDDKSIVDGLPSFVVGILCFTGLIVFIAIIDFILSIPEALNEWAYIRRQERNERNNNDNN